MAMFFPARFCASPTVTPQHEHVQCHPQQQPHDPPTAQPSCYDNHRASCQSLSSCSRHGNHHSTASISALATFEEGDELSQHERPTRQRLPTTMLHAGGVHGRMNSVVDMCETAPPNLLDPNAIPPRGLLRKIKFYYDRWGCRKFVPVTLLVLYSFLGAAMFHLVEYDNEQQMLLEEQRMLDRLRNETMRRIRQVVLGSASSVDESRNILTWYEKQLDVVRLLPGLPWDFWGALFYVGTLYTTIGYGNIFPRTNTGRALSVVYAIVGIPLVLAILSQCGRAMTNSMSEWWRRRRFLQRKANKQHKMSNATNLASVESGGVMTPEADEIDESRTIPIWLALGLCVGWISACAGVFCLWESRWNYFTSLYFFCISLSTIGLGDVVPDHPHMLILMFWLVIIGLCIVSMLLSVIQIKMEEWLYNFMIRMQKKYAEALAESAAAAAASGRPPPDVLSLRRMVLDEQPWFMRTIAPSLLTDQQQAQIDAQAETLERVAREWNNKHIQTDFGPRTTTINKGAQACEAAISAACDAISFRQPVEAGETQWSEQLRTAAASVAAPPSASGAFLRVTRGTSQDSLSEAPSLPIDSYCEVPRAMIAGAAGGRRRSSGTDAFCSVASDFADYGNPTDYCIEKEKKQLRLAEINVQASIRSEEDEVTQSGRSGGGKKGKASHEAQTDIAQFQIDEILLKLHSIQQQRAACRSPEGKASAGSVMDRSIETSLSILELMDGGRGHSAAIDDKSIQCEAALMDRAVLTDMLTALQHHNVATATTSTELAQQWTQAAQERRDSGTGATPPPHLEPVTVGTSMSESSIFPPKAELVDSGTEVSLRESMKEKNDAETQYSEAGSVPEFRDHASSTLGVAACASRTVETTPPRVRRKSARVDGPFLQACTQTSEEEMDQVFPQSPPPMILCEASTSMEALLDQQESSTQVTPPRERRSGTAASTVAATQTLSSLSPSPHSVSPCSPLHRTDSNASLCGSLLGDDNKQEVIVQTDDSYLKIARRLDAYRSNRTQFLPVCAADPIAGGSAGSSASNGRAFCIDPFKDRRKSLRFSTGRRKSSVGFSQNNGSQTSKSLDPDQLDKLLRGAEDRTSHSASPPPLTSPCGGRRTSDDLARQRKCGVGGMAAGSLIQRKMSLPAGIPRGRVSDFVAKHEKGIPNPATAPPRKVTIIRQCSLDNQ